MLEHHYIKQYNFLSLICISDADVKFGERTKSMLLKTLKKRKTKERGS